MTSEAPSIVGRRSELSALDAALEAVEAGTFAAVAVEGEPGIGKTRLLDELRGSARARGHAVLDGAGAEFERDAPFGVIVEALDAFLVSEQAAPEAWAASDADVLDELARIFPALRSASGPPAAAVGDERYRMHRALRVLLERVAVARPLVIVLDDVHWADDASLEVIASVLRRPPAARVLLAVGFRSGEASNRLEVALAAAGVVRLGLSPLTEPESRELLGDRLQARARDAIYREAGGNPFYLEQLARSPAWSGRARSAGPLLDARVPAAVVASLAAELAELSPTTQALLRGAAVAGEAFEPDLAGSAAELTPPVALAALDELLARELVRDTDEPRRFVFRHPLVRRVVYDGAPGGWRLAAHARVADELARRGASAAERARHAEHAAVRGDEEAIALLVQAARETVSRAPASAVRWLGAALRLLPASDRERRVELLELHAGALRSTGDLEGCRTALLEALEMLQRPGGARRAELTAACAAAEHWLGRHEEAGARLQRAWEDLPATDGPEAARLAIELATDSLFQLDFERTREMGELALATARALGDRTLAAWAASVLCFAAATGGETAEARARQAEAAAAIDALSDDELAGCLDAVYHLVWAESYLERFEQALARADRGIAVARRSGEGQMTVPLMLSKLYSLEMLGRLGEALGIVERATESARLATNPQYLYWALWEAAYVRGLMGDSEEAYALSKESKDVAHGRGRNMPGTAEPGWLAGFSRVMIGDVDGGREELLEAFGGPAVANVVPAERTLALHDLTWVELQAGRLAEAADCVRRVQACAQQLDRPVATAHAARCEAELLLAQERPTDAVAAAQRALDALDGSAAAYEVAVSRGLLGRALAAAGTRDRAVTTLRAAEQELDACDARGLRDGVRRELRRLGARIEPRGPAAGADSGLASLSPREREISELVTERLTNPQIAAKLFLSEKTIETHLRSVFRKLGVASRVEVARQVEQARREAATTAAAAPDFARYPS